MRMHVPYVDLGKTFHFIINLKLNVEVSSANSLYFVFYFTMQHDFYYGFVVVLYNASRLLSGLASDRGKDVSCDHT